MRRAGNQDSKPRGARRYSRTPVTNYYRGDAAAQSPFKNRPPKKNRRKYLFGLADVVLIVILIVALIYSLMLRDTANVIASNESYRSARQYAKLIQPDLSGLANKNKITFDESSVVNSIEKSFPEVRAASIELPFFSEQPTIRLLISAPAFKLKSQGQTYVVDQQGVVVTDNADQPRFAKLTAVDDQSGYRAVVGKPVISSTSANFISTVISQSQRAKVPISNLILPAIPLEADLRTKDQPYYVKFYLGGDPNLESGQFLAARQKFTQSHITPTQYLDVRVEGKVFYK